MNTISLDDTVVLSTDNKLEMLRSLNSRAQQLSTSDTGQALALAEEAVEYARLWCNQADIEPEYQPLITELAHSLRLLARCRYLLGQYKIVEEPAMEALDLYTGLQKEAEQIDLHNTLALLYWKTGRYDEALMHLFIALGRHQKKGDRTSESRTLNNIGLVYDKLGDYPTALDYLLKSLEIDRENGDKKAESRALCNIGILYSQMEDFQQALEHYQQCLEYEESIGDKDAQCGLLNNIGVVYGRLNHCETSLKYLERCLEIRRDLGDQSGEALVLCNTGDMYAALGRYDEAMHDLQTALDIYRDQASSEGMSRALSCLGTLHWKMNNAAQAIAYLEEALAMAEAMGAKSFLYEIHEHLYKIYRQQGDTARALDHHEQFHKIRENVHSEANNKRLAALQTLHQVEKSRKETEIYRLRNVELACANQQLQTFNLEKNEMLGIVAHDLKNPLNSIRLLSRLMNSQADGLRNDEIRDYTADIETMVARMFELIDNLLDINKIETQGITVSRAECDISAIIRAVVDNHTRHASGKNIAIEFSVVCADNNTIVSTDPTLVRQIVDNLLSNAVKFSPFDSAISVRLGVRNSGFRVEVEDQGPGMTEEDKQKLFTKFARLSARPTGNENSTGLGLSIVKKMAEALKGDICCQSEQGKGTLFIAEFPA